MKLGRIAQVISALEWLRQEDYEFKASLGYIVSSRLASQVQTLSQRGGKKDPLISAWPYQKSQEH